MERWLAVGLGREESPPSAPPPAAVAGRALGSDPSAATASAKGDGSVAVGNAGSGAAASTGRLVSGLRGEH